MNLRSTNPQRHKSRANDLRPLICCVIFDLDDTLYDSLAQRVRLAHRHAAQAMIKAGLKGTLEAVYRARMRAFHHDPMLRYIDPAVCRQFGASNIDDIIRAARDAYFHCPVGKLTPFRGTIPLLNMLHARGVKVFIVTFGEPKIQRAKVRALGLEKHPAIDKVFCADRNNLLTKEGAFQIIQQELDLPANQVLIVGDRAMSEIRAGNDLGMHTVRLRRGEFASQHPHGREEEADYEVKDISGVRKLPFQWGAPLFASSQAKRGLELSRATRGNTFTRKERKG